MRPKRIGSHKPKSPGAAWGKRRLSRTEAGLLLFVGLFTVFTLFAFFHTVENLHRHGQNERAVVAEEVRAVEEKVLKLLSGDADKASRAGDGAPAGGGGTKGRVRGGRERRSRAKEITSREIEKDCLRKVFKFYTPLSSSSLDGPSGPNEHSKTRGA